MTSPGVGSRRFAGPGLIAATAAVMLWWSWGHWPDAVIDFGRELYLPWRLSEGDVLYRDYRHLSGPLSAYWNALVFGILGTGLRQLVLANLAVLGVIAALVYHLVASQTDRFAATCAGLVFVVAFGFGQLDTIGNFNYLAPYSHELVHGLLFSLAMLAILARLPRLGASGPIWVGAAVGVVTLTKPEVALAALSACATYAAISLAAGRGRARSAWQRPLALWLVGAALPPVVAVAGLGTRMPLSEAVQSLLDPYRFAANPEVHALRFYRWGLGTLGIEANMRLAAVWALAWVALAGLAVGGGRLLRQPTWFRLPATLAACAAVLALARPAHVESWLHVTRPLPFFLAAFVLFWGIRAALRPRPADEVHATAFPLAAAVFALVLSGKMALHALLQYYGFVLVMPATILAVGVLTGSLPRWVARSGGYALFTRAVGATAVAASLLGLVQVMGLHYARHRFVMGTGVDAFLADGRAEYLDRAAQIVRERFPEDVTVAVFPEGVMLNFLLRVRNPTPYLSFMPPEVILFGESRMVSALEGDPPDVAIVIHRPTPEYGLPFFGRDYGERVYGWLTGNYELAYLVGDPPLEPDSSYGVAILSRVPGGAERRLAASPAQPSSSRTTTESSASGASSGSVTATPESDASN